MRKKSIYFGGGFRDYQILYMLPILDGFCTKNKIKKIIFEKELPKSFLKLSHVHYFFQKYEIIFLPKKRLKKFWKVSSLIYLFYILNYFFLSFFVNKKNILDKNISWLKAQLYHSIWDTCIVNNKISLDRFEFKSRIKSAMQIAQKKIDFMFIKKHSCFFAFIQHTVYSERFLFALLRNYNVKIFVQNKHVIIKQKKERDFGFKFLDKKIFLNSYRCIKENDIQKYWKKILRGKSNYLEARIAANLKNKRNKKNLSERENVIMLHIFKDSPFTNIDRERIFQDYYSWVLETLQIIRDSNEKWIIRKHPSADRWGEKQKLIIDKILFKVFGKKIPKNILFEDNQKSNLNQFRITKRLLTFSGNSHLEAACFGIKPIVISNTTLCDLDNNLVIKPKSLSQYKKVLLKGSDEDFKITEKKISMCKRILFLIQNVINFSDDVSSFHAFRNDPKKVFKLLFKKILIKSNKNYDLIYKIGYNLNFNYDQSINLKYMYKFYKKR